jgi:hypothetical protein
MRLQLILLAKAGGAGLSQLESGSEPETGQVSFETVPGRSTGELPGIHDAPLPERTKFHNELARILYPEGRDVIAEAFGIPVRGSFVAPGSYRGDANPSTQVLVEMPRQQNGQIDPAFLPHLSAYASALGHLLKQDAIGYHNPYVPADPAEENALQVEVGRPLYHWESEGLDRALEAAFGPDSYALIASPGGVRVLNFTGLPNPEFLTRAANAADSYLAERRLLPRYKAYAADSDLIGNNWEEFPNGETYRHRIGATGRSDLYRTLYDIYAPQIASVYREYGQKYGPDEEEHRAVEAGRPGGGLAAEKSPGLTLIHYSAAPRTVIDPAYMGTAMAGAERARPNRIPRIYYYGENATPEPRFRAFHRHVVRLPSANIYDIGRDPDGIVQRLREQGYTGYELMDRLERAVAVAGYDGYINSLADKGEVHAIFRPVQLNPDGTAMWKALRRYGKILLKATLAQAPRSLPASRYIHELRGDHVYLTPYGMELMAHVLLDPTLRQFRGAYISPSNLDLVQRAIKQQLRHPAPFDIRDLGPVGKWVMTWVAGRPISYVAPDTGAAKRWLRERRQEHREAVQQFQQATEQANTNGQNGGIVYINTGTVGPIQETIKTLRHEHMHQAHHTSPPGPHNFFPHEDMAVHPYYTMALQRLRGEPDNPTVYGRRPVEDMPDEMLARLGAGQHETLGLNDEQAKALLHHFAQVGTARHGEAFYDLFRRAHYVPRRWINEYRQNTPQGQALDTLGTQAGADQSGTPVLGAQAGRQGGAGTGVRYFVFRAKNPQAQKPISSYWDENIGIDPHIFDRKAVLVLRSGRSFPSASWKKSLPVKPVHTPRPPALRGLYPILLRKSQSRRPVRGQLLGSDYRFHNAPLEAIEAIRNEGMRAGSFADRPIDMGHSHWLAVHHSDLPGPVQVHTYGEATAYEPQWERGLTEDGEPLRNVIAPEKILRVNSRGRVIGRLKKSVRAYRYLILRKALSPYRKLAPQEMVGPDQVFRFYTPQYAGGRTEVTRVHEIRPLDEADFARFIQPNLPPGYAPTLADYQLLHPDHTHIHVTSVPLLKRPWEMRRVGPQHALIPYDAVRQPYVDMSGIAPEERYESVQQHPSLPVTRMEIYPLNEATFRRFLRPIVKRQYARDVAMYKARKGRQDATHLAVIGVAGQEQRSPIEIGTKEELQPGEDMQPVGIGDDYSPPPPVEAEEEMPERLQPDIYESLTRADSGVIPAARDSGAIPRQTTSQNAERGIARIEQLLGTPEHPGLIANPLESEETWAQMMAHATGQRYVLSAPTKAITFARDPEAIAQAVSSLSERQQAQAEAGLEEADRWLADYQAGRVLPTTTGLFFLWGFLSRSLSPYPHEAAFIEVLNEKDKTGRPRILKYLQAAQDGDFEHYYPEYMLWSQGTRRAQEANREYARNPKFYSWVVDYSGLNPEAFSEESPLANSPGVQAAFNLTAFGRFFLRRMGLPIQEGEYAGKTLLAVMHELMQSGRSGQEIRREWFRLVPSVGISNKVLSFILQLTGRKDVLVLDRVQVNHLWGSRDRFGGVGLYDGIPVRITRTGEIERRGISSHLQGLRGLLVYEAIEKGLQPAVQTAYSRLGRDGSLGRFHWETWVKESGQEAGHGSIQAIRQANDLHPNPVEGTGAYQGKYDTYSYGTRYANLGERNLHVMYDSQGHPVVFDPGQHPKFLEALRKEADTLNLHPAKRSVPYGTRPSIFETHPWTDILSPTQRSNFDRLLRRFGREPDLYEEQNLARLADGLGRPAAYGGAGRVRKAVGGGGTRSRQGGFAPAEKRRSRRTVARFLVIRKAADDQESQAWQPDKQWNLEGWRHIPTGIFVSPHFVATRGFNASHPEIGHLGTFPTKEEAMSIVDRPEYRPVREVVNYFNNLSGSEPDIDKYKIGYHGETSGQLGSEGWAARRPLYLAHTFDDAAEYARGAFDKDDWRGDDFYGGGFSKYNRNDPTGRVHTFSYEHTKPLYVGSPELLGHLWMRSGNNGDTIREAMKYFVNMARKNGYKSIIVPAEAFHILPGDTEVAHYARYAQDALGSPQTIILDPKNAKLMATHHVEEARKALILLKTVAYNRETRQWRAYGPNAAQQPAPRQPAPRRVQPPGDKAIFDAARELGLTHISTSMTPTDWGPRYQMFFHAPEGNAQEAMSGMALKLQQHGKTKTNWEGMQTPAPGQENSTGVYGLHFQRYFDPVKNRFDPPGHRWQYEIYVTPHAPQTPERRDVALRRSDTLYDVTRPQSAAQPASTSTGMGQAQPSETTYARTGEEIRQEPEARRPGYRRMLPAPASETGAAPAPASPAAPKIKTATKTKTKTNPASSQPATKTKTARGAGSVATPDMDTLTEKARRAQNWSAVYRLISAHPELTNEQVQQLIAAYGNSRLYIKSVILMRKSLRFSPPPSPNRKEKPYVGKIEFAGIPIAIETAKGSYRTGIAGDGTPWATRMRCHYGCVYGLGAKGADGDLLDCYVGPDKDAKEVYIIDQKHIAGPHKGKFDEQKCMIGFKSKKAAIKCYDKHHTYAKQIRGRVYTVSVERFRELCRTMKKGDRLTKAQQQEEEEGDSGLIEESPGRFRRGEQTYDATSIRPPQTGENEQWFGTITAHHPHAFHDPTRTVGSLLYHYFPASRKVHIVDVFVNAPFRRRGIATDMYRILNTVVKRHWPDAEHVAGSLMGGAPLKIRNRVFGEPILLMHPEPDLQQEQPDREGDPETQITHYAVHPLKPLSTSKT